MSGMTELVARAIYEASNHNKPYSQISAFQREKCEREAIAAMVAMQDPTDEMVEAGERARMEHTDIYFDGSEVAKNPERPMFIAMIEAAVKEPA